MDSTRYAMTQLALMDAVTAFSALELDAFIDKIDKADTLGAVIDPTLYRRNLAAGDPLSVMRTLALAARQMVAVLPRSCRGCGCTLEKACEGGCSWIAPGMCSNCAPVTAGR